MSIATPNLIKAFLGVNVHPANLSILNADGERKYTGDDAVRDALLAGEEYIRSSTHIIEEIVDAGRILMISSPLKVDLNIEGSFEGKEWDYRTDKNQDQLKKIGDHIIFPKTIFDIAQGRYSKDDKGMLYFDGTPIPNGLKLN